MTATIASSLETRLLPVPTAGSPHGQAWETLVQACPESGFMQSLAWADFKQRRGMAVRWAGIFAGNDLVGGALLYAAEQANGAALLVAPEGPVLPWADSERSAECLRSLMALLAQQAPALGAVGVRIEPRLLAPKPPALRDFRPAPMELVPSQTLYLDLRPESTAQLAAMHAKGRYNIRLAARHGVTVRETADPAAVRPFYDLLDEAAGRDGFYVEPAGFFSDLASALCPSGMARFVFAEHDGDVLGAMLLLTYGRRATYLYGGVANQKRHVMAGYALQWEAMQAAKRLGCASYDFYGFEPLGVSDHLYAGFSRFKRQFGGEAVRFTGPLDHIFIDRLADLVVKAVQEIG